MIVRAILNPMLKTTRSMVSKLSEDVLIGTFFWKIAFAKAYPGKKSTNITPKVLRMYTMGYKSCGITKTVKVVTKAIAIIIQYHAALKLKR